MIETQREYGWFLVKIRSFVTGVDYVYNFLNIASLKLLASFSRILKLKKTPIGNFRSVRLVKSVIDNYDALILVEIELEHVLQISNSNTLLCGIILFSYRKLTNQDLIRHVYKVLCSIPIRQIRTLLSIDKVDLNLIRYQTIHSRWVADCRFVYILHSYSKIIHPYS